jgi:hypothetical protein
MQAVGRECLTCHQKVFSALDGNACAACDVAFHTDCAGGTKRCPKCSVDVSIAEAAEREQRGARESAVLQSGRNIYVGVVLFSSCLIAIDIAMIWYLELPLEHSIQVCVRTMLTVGLLLAMRHGRAWAAKALAAFSGLGILVCAGALVLLSINSSVRAAMVMAMMVLAIVTVGLTRPSLYAFIASRRTRFPR